MRRAALSSIIPFGGQRGANGFEIEGQPAAPGQTLIADQRYVSPNYLETMNIPMVEGRGFLATDDARAEPVVLVNRTMARRFWPNTSPIDHRIRTTAGFDSTSWFRIVGVVEDVRHVSLSRDAVTEMYRPIAQTAMSNVTLVVRTDREPASLAPSARATVQALDPNLPIYDVRTMEDRIAGSFAQTRGTMLLLLVTAALAAALSGVAIYGSIWYSVSQRIPEIGVRLALGASRGSVFAGVLRRAVALTGIGALIGVCGTLAGGRLIAGLLFDTRATDPGTLAAVVAATMALAVVAGIVPARRAMSVDPADGVTEMSRGLGQFLILHHQIGALARRAIEEELHRAIAAREVGRENLARRHPPGQREVRRLRQHVREPHRDFDRQAARVEREINLPALEPFACRHGPIDPPGFGDSLIAHASSPLVRGGARRAAYGSTSRRRSDPSGCPHAAGSRRRRRHSPRIPRRRRRAWRS